MKEDKIVLKELSLAKPVVPIEKWILAYNCLLWKRAFRDFFVKGATFTKGKEFLSQPNIEKASKRAVVCYFNLELLSKLAIDSNNIPAQFLKWLDTSSADCIFSDYQRKNFARPHLLQCPWYLELHKGEVCLDEERAHQSRCDRET